MLIIGPNLFISQSSPDHSPYIHIMKSRDQTSVLSSVTVGSGYFQKVFSIQNYLTFKLSENWHSVRLDIYCIAFETESFSSLVHAFFLFICRGRTITTQLFVVMGIAIGHILDGNWWKCPTKFMPRLWLGKAQIFFIDMIIQRSHLPRGFLIK